MTDSKKRYFTIEHRPAADGGVWTVLSPEGTSVWRTDSIEEARDYMERRNGRVEDEAAGLGEVVSQGVTSAAYKPAHGGYPGEVK